MSFCSNFTLAFWPGRAEEQEASDLRSLESVKQDFITQDMIKMFILGSSRINTLFQGTEKTIKIEWGRVIAHRKSTYLHAALSAFCLLGSRLLKSDSPWKDLTTGCAAVLTVLTFIKTYFLFGAIRSARSTIQQAIDGKTQEIQSSFSQKK